jgi:DNA anti-recombination protein RmuC
MPVTAKLSRKFYEKFGDDIANELVDWFNMVDATYRSELRELNDLNYARFDAKLEQRIAELRAEMYAGFARLEAKFDTKLAELDAKLDTKLAELEAKLDTKLAELEARFDTKLEQRIAELETRLTRRLFGFWIAQAATTVGLVLGVAKLLH